MLQCIAIYGSKPRFEVVDYLVIVSSAVDEFAGSQYA